MILKKLININNIYNNNKIIRTLSHKKLNLELNKKQLGNGITHYDSPIVNKNTNNTVVVITSWLFAKDNQLKPYIQFYLNQGISILTISVDIFHILNPNKSKKQMESIINEVLKLTSKNIIYHQFSTGGFLYAQQLRILLDDKEKKINNFYNYENKIKAQIFDSIPDVNSIPIGVSKHYKNPIIENIMKYTIKFYLKLVENTTGVEHRLASNIMHNNYIKAPSLFFYSKTDIIAPMEDIEIVMNKWKNNNIPVESCCFENTKHIQHARQEPEMYFGTLKDFLLKNKLI